MGIHVEWFSTKYLTVGIAPAGEEIGEDTVNDGDIGLTFGEDSVVVIEGTPAEVREKINRALALLDEHEHGALPSLPEPTGDDEDEEGATCPHVWTAEDVERLRAAEDDFVARMRETDPGYTPSPSATPRVPVVGSTCGADLMLWDQDPVVRYLYTAGGHWVAGPSKSGDGGGGDEEVNCGNMHYWSVPDIQEWQ